MQELFQSAIDALAGVLDPHGPAVAAAANSFAPGDFSVHFFLQLAIILIMCRVVGKLGQKFLGQPQVVGEMIAGVLLGPSLFGLCFPEWQKALFPPESLKVLFVGAQLGVGLYMFIVGVDFRTELFASRARSAAAVSEIGRAHV